MIRKFLLLSLALFVATQTEIPSAFAGLGETVEQIQARYPDATMVGKLDGSGAGLVDFRFPDHSKLTVDFDGGTSQEEKFYLGYQTDKSTKSGFRGITFDHAQMLDFLRANGQDKSWGTREYDGLRGDGYPYRNFSLNRGDGLARASIFPFSGDSNRYVYMCAWSQAHAAKSKLVGEAAEKNRRARLGWIAWIKDSAGM